jgi:beta-lactamase class A
VHACAFDRPGDVALRADELVVSASVFKVAVALELFRRADAGELEVTERVRVDPATSLGAPAGLSLFSDEVDVSLRDLAVSMLTVSDALATDVLLERLGIDRVNSLTRSLGLEQTEIVCDLRTMFDTLAEDAGFATWRELAAFDWDDADERVVAETLERIRGARMCDPARATRTTARETTRLLAAIWDDEAAPAAACAPVRDAMARQLQRERIARGLPDGADVLFSGKTGSFGGAFRNEAGVVEFRAGGRYAIAVFTRAHELYTRSREIDEAIGRASALALTALRDC